MIDDGSSHTLASMSGIPIRVHYSYYVFVCLLVLGCVLFASSVKALLVAQVVGGTFFAVLFHEIGHAYVAHRLNHRVQDIVIFPVGGIATIFMNHTKHVDVIKIALAGPAVNIIIGCLFVLLPFDWAYNIGLINLFLGAGNLLPVRSFDGGLVLHAVVSKIYNKRTANDLIHRSTILIVCAVATLGFITSSVTICAAGLFIFVYGVLTREEG